MAGAKCEFLLALVANLTRLCLRRLGRNEKLNSTRLLMRNFELTVKLVLKTLIKTRKVIRLAGNLEHNQLFIGSRKRRAHIGRIDFHNLNLALIKKRDLKSLIQ